MKTHELKLDTKFFDDVKSGKKNFEIRKNDRDYQVGDILKLKAFRNNHYMADYGTRGCGNGFEVVDKGFANQITVRVTAIMDVADYNSYAESKKPSQVAQTHEVERNGHWFNFSKVDKVLNEYFETNYLPDGYIVMGIEVIE